MLPLSPPRVVARMNVNDISKAISYVSKGGGPEKKKKKGWKCERKFLLACNTLSRLGQHTKAQEESRRGEENIPPSYVHLFASTDASAVAM